MKKKKILIIKLSSLGDVIFSIPLANNLKDNGNEVHFLTTEKGIDIIKNNPCVDKVLFFPLYSWRKNYFNLKYIVQIIKLFIEIRKEHYDIALDCQRRIKSLPFLKFCGAKRRIILEKSKEGAFLGANEFSPIYHKDSKHMVMRSLDYARHLGYEVKDIKMSLPQQTEETKAKIDTLIKDIDKSKPLVIIAPATTWVTKHWDKDNWIKVVEALKESCNLIFTGMSKDQDLITSIGGDKFLNLTGKTNLNDLIELYSRVDLVIAPDSGSAHLAWASAKPALIEIYCSTEPEYFGCFGNDEKYYTLVGNLDCGPCTKRTCKKKDNKNICLKAVSAEEVINIAKKILQ